MNCKWERAKKSEFPIVAYRVYYTSVDLSGDKKRPANRKKRQAKQPDGEMRIKLNDASTVGVELFHKGQDEIGTEMRLPYTMETLKNRALNGKDLPSFIKVE